MYEKLGSTYLCFGDYKQAITYFYQSLIITKEMGERVTEGNVYHRLGVACRCLDDYKEATVHLKQSLIIAKETTNRAKEHDTHKYLGCGRFSVLHVNTNILQHYLQTSLHNL